MPIIVDENIVALLGEATAFGKAAANKLTADPHPCYPKDRAHILRDDRIHVNLNTQENGFNPLPWAKVRPGLIIGWRMQNAPFFISNKGVLMIKWHGTYFNKKIKLEYASVVNSITASTVSVFFSESDIRNVRDELIDIVAPY